MTLLMYGIDPTQIYIVMDTLAARPDGSPLIFQTKMMAFPHIEVVVAATGSANLASQWFALVRERIPSRDIDTLDARTPQALRELLEDLGGDEALRSTATIYHFGWSPTEDRYVGYAYRSTNDFESERLADGFGVKPVTEVDGERVLDFETPTTVEEIFELAKVRHGLHDGIEGPFDVPIRIGGDIIATFMNARVITMQKLGTLDGFEDHWQEIERNL